MSRQAAVALALLSALVGAFMGAATMFVLLNERARPVERVAARASLPEDDNGVQPAERVRDIEARIVEADRGVP